MKKVDGLEELGGYNFVVTSVKQATAMTLRGSSAADHGCNDCVICLLASKKGFSFKNPDGRARLYPIASPFPGFGAVGGPQLVLGYPVRGPGDTEEDDFCKKCFEKKEPDDNGPHVCVDRNRRFENLKKLLSPKTREMLATDEIKSKTVVAEAENKDFISLARKSGPTMHLPTSSAAARSSAPVQVKANFFQRLMTDLNLSGVRAKKAARIYKEETCGKVCAFLMTICVFVIICN